MKPAPPAGQEHISDNQVERAADLLEMQAKPAASDANPEAPATPFPTSLVLTRDQEDRMVQFALDYIERLITATGRTITQGQTVAVPDLNTWMGKREMFTMRYYNHVEDRAARDPKSIYGVSNITATISQRITMQMVARANNFFFGTEPWYSANFVGVEDKHKAEKIDRHSKWKFGKMGLRGNLEQANEFAFVRGETVVKSTYLTQDRLFQRKGKALFDVATRQQVLDTKGNPIFNDAIFTDEIGPQLDPATGQPIIDPATGQPAIAPTGRQILKRDPKIYMPLQPEYRDGIWPMRQRLAEGPEAKIVYFKDFLCPLEADSVDTAELICHLYDLPVMNVVQNFRRMDLAQMGAKDTLASLQKAVDAIRDLAGGSTTPSTAASQPRTDFKEQQTSASTENPFAEIAEIYMTYDANGDGLPEEIMLVLDRKNRFPLFYDYLDNVTPTGKRPFKVVRAKAVDGRWYGMGAMEYFQPEQEFIDLMVNRRNFKWSKAGRVTFWNPSATIEGQTQPNLKMNDGGTYKLREGFKAEDALSYVVLPDDGADLMEFLNFFMQLMQLKSGIINAGDQEASGMPASNTATGIRNVEKSGQEMFAAFLTCLEPGQQGILLQQIELLYAYISQNELFRFFDAGAGADQYDTISPEEVAEMQFDVQILLTRVRTEQVLQTSAEARSLVLEFYTQYPPQIQAIVAPMFRDSLKALGLNNADDLIVAQPMPMLGAPMQGGAPGGQAANGDQQIAAAPAAKGLDVPAAPSSSPATPAPLI
jgi:hypothetical protein